QRDEDVRRLDVPMDNPLLVRVLDGIADLDEQVETFPGGEVVLVAILGDADAAHQFHDKIGATCLGGAGIEYSGNVGVIHHRQRLPLGFEAGHHRLGVHTQLDNLERDSTADRFSLFGDIDNAA